MIFKQEPVSSSIPKILTEKPLPALWSLEEKDLQPQHTETPGRPRKPPPLKRIDSTFTELKLVFLGPARTPFGSLLLGIYDHSKGPRIFSVEKVPFQFLPLICLVLAPVPSLKTLGTTTQNHPKNGKTSTNPQPEAQKSVRNPGGATGSLAEDAIETGPHGLVLLDP